MVSARRRSHAPSARRSAGCELRAAPRRRDGGDHRAAALAVAAAYHYRGARLGEHLAHASPIPLVDPVTNTTFFAKLISAHSAAGRVRAPQR